MWPHFRQAHVRFGLGVTDGDWLTFSQIRISPYPRLPKQVVLQSDLDTYARMGHPDAYENDTQR